MQFTYHSRPFPRERQGGCPTDPGGGSRDNSGFASKAHVDALAFISEGC
jgi:hypothetical protein